jgi:hypothetical protein
MTTRAHGEPELSMAEALRRKAIANALRAELAVARAKDELIEHARRWVAARAAAIALALERWPDRVAALMAAELGVEADRMLRVLDEHVRDLREELAALPPRAERDE